MRTANVVTMHRAVAPQTEVLTDRTASGDVARWFQELNSRAPIRDHISPIKARCVLGSICPLHSVGVKIVVQIIDRNWNTGLHGKNTVYLPSA